jgi:hypothetical protein
MELRRRGHAESQIKKIVYDNPIEFFSGSERFEFTPPDVFSESAPAGVDAE